MKKVFGFLKKTRDKAVEKVKVLKAMALALMFGSLKTENAFADGSVDTSQFTGGSFQTIIFQFVSVIAFIALVVGVILGVWGAFTLIEGMLRDDPDSKSKGAKVVGVAIALVVFKVIAGPIANALLSAQ